MASASNTAKDGNDPHNGSSTDSDSSESSDEGGIENASDESSSDSDSDSDSDADIPVDAVVPSAEDLGLGEAVKRHVANMNFNDAQKWLWKLSRMTSYDRECCVKRISSKSATSAIAALAPTVEEIAHFEKKRAQAKKPRARKKANAAQAPRPSSMQGSVLFRSPAVSYIANDVHDSESPSNTIPTP